ncbi:MAG: winged helix-turn-helix transcriptional regulator [Bacillota bacterium]|nr:winged helix-turn-helix transcriptional regulator [Bacillota bacterium]
MNEISKLLTDYNSIIKENDKLYREAAKALGLADCAFWILYAMREASGSITQRDMVNMNYFPPQTINSALKKLETEGYVELRTISDKRKKQVYLTPDGEQLAIHTADRVIAIEMETMASLTPQEQQAFLSVFRKYTDLLKKNLSVLDGSK